MEIIQKINTIENAEEEGVEQPVEGDRDIELEMEGDGESKDSPKIDYRQYYAFKHAERDVLQTDIGLILEQLRKIRDKKRANLKKAGQEEFVNEMNDLEITIIKQLSKGVQTDNKILELEIENAKLREEIKALKGMGRQPEEKGLEKEKRQRNKPVDQINKDIYSIVIENVEDGQENVKDLIRREIRETGKKLNIEDITTTKSNKLIMKAEKKEELDDVYKWITANKKLEEKIKCSAPARKAERLMLLGMAPDTDKEQIKEELMNIVKGIDPNITPYKPLRRRDGLLNWMIDVDAKTKIELLERGRVCIDMMRVRVVEYIRIWRCFICQKLGHTSNRCRGELTCGKCAGKHNTRDCTSEEENCANCSENNKHRSDSYACPTFSKYKRDLIAKRL